MPLGYCPVCEVQMMLDYLDALAAVMRKVNTSEWRHAWRSARIDLEVEIQCCEKYSIEELRWQAEHPEIDVSDRYTSTKALERIWDEYSYIGKSKSSVSYDSMYAGNKTAKKNGNSYLNKAVYFDEAFSEAPCQCRAYEKLCRDSPEYEPGRHACPSPENWLDTSLADENLYNLEQMRIYSTTDLDTFQLWEEDPSTLPEDHEDAAVMHPYWDEIDNYCEELRTSEELFIREGFDMFCARSDAIAILIDEKSREFVDMRLLKAEDDWEDEDECGDQFRDGLHWASFGQCKRT
ncbi:hypothetical protein K504DRAFT_488987 [Pleomassaria siparia CBS 279.74]|uniref:Uncharacterized protein n=1 Tax=Pleomassaria siparia CBS 279.74 TaxID=1314801 RepID=A0A6G1KIZ2_9PLEO|nr:hypothetical protein K504DRAFT_488987 [Pleomassaria siparia CBS 279.74]